MNIGSVLSFSVIYCNMTTRVAFRVKDSQWEVNQTMKSFRNEISFCDSIGSTPVGDHKIEIFAEMETLDEDECIELINSYFQNKLSVTDEPEIV